MWLWRHFWCRLFPSCRRVELQRVRIRCSDVLIILPFLNWSRSRLHPIINLLQKVSDSKMHCARHRSIRKRYISTKHSIGRCIMIITNLSCSRCSSNINSFQFNSISFSIRRFIASRCIFNIFSKLFKMFPNISWR